jgi:hypothetical protein
MAAFSRGWLLRPQGLVCKLQHFTLRSKSVQGPSIRQSFSTSQIVRFAAKKLQQPSTRAPTSALKSSVPPPKNYQSFAESLAVKTHPTLLYTAPPHTLYIVASYTGAFFCFSYAAYNFNANYANAPPDLSPWVPVAFGGVCFLMACFGGWLVLGPARLIKTITAIPPPQALAKGAGRQGPLKIEIELRKMFPLPFFPARKITGSMEDLTLNRRLYAPIVEGRMTAADRVAMQRRLEREQQEERSKSILTAPFRHANKAFHNMFRAMGRTWSREGFLQLEIRRQAYKLDVTGGWALDDGKALDKLVRVKL